MKILKQRNRACKRFDLIINSSKILTENIDVNYLPEIKRKWLQWRSQQKHISLHEEIHMVLFMLWTVKYGEVAKQDENLETATSSIETIVLSKQADRLTTISIVISAFAGFVSIAVIIFNLIRFLLF